MDMLLEAERILVEEDAAATGPYFEVGVHLVRAHHKELRRPQIRRRHRPEVVEARAIGRQARDHRA